MRYRTALLAAGSVVVAGCGSRVDLGGPVATPVPVRSSGRVAGPTSPAPAGSSSPVRGSSPTSPVASATGRVDLDAPYCSTGSAWITCTGAAQAAAWWPDGHLFVPTTGIAHTYVLHDSRGPGRQPALAGWSHIWLVLHPRGGSPRTNRFEDVFRRGGLVLHASITEDRASIPPHAGEPTRIQGHLGVRGTTTPEPGKPSSWIFDWYEDYGTTEQIRWNATALSTVWPDETEVLDLVNSLRRV